MSNTNKIALANSDLLWVHCNRCLDLYLNKQRRLFLLACYHTFCEACVLVFPSPVPGATPTYACQICKKRKHGRQVGNMMPPHLKVLFQPKPWGDNVPLIRVYGFQIRHRKMFFKCLIRTQVNFMRTQQNSEHALRAASSTFRKMEQMRQARKILERRVEMILEERQKLEEQRKQAQQQKLWEIQRKQQMQRENWRTSNSFNTTSDSGIFFNSSSSALRYSTRPRFHTQLPPQSRSGGAVLTPRSFFGNIYQPRAHNSNASIQSFSSVNDTSFFL